HLPRPVQRYGHGHAPAPAPATAHYRCGDGSELPVDGVGQLDLPVALEIPAILQTLGQLEERAHREKRNGYDHEGRKQHNHGVPPFAPKTPAGGGRETSGRNSRRAEDADPGGSWS